ncbi:hypothetical protein SAMN02745218_02987 [Desulfofundulus australicus DSM 11792]|uniref:Uncharacterized protein n=1 Tax=Desulfofundulus australicus DSM 11792 TaxID=1121425 RepID=A0A1M5E4U8_9FIRM|nr:hypothetical protein [Desulfofundulus australicus]SHF74102.1 hypothetical protein SAMN02745218_02987 [Desulfofundulus australicus DSM 11792]
MQDIAKVIKGAFISPNERDNNFEPANVVDGLYAIARALDRLAEAVEQLANPKED